MTIDNRERVRCLSGAGTGGGQDSPCRLAGRAASPFGYSPLCHSGDPLRIRKGSGERGKIVRIAHLAPGSSPWRSLYRTVFFDPKRGRTALFTTVVRWIACEDNLPSLPSLSK